MRKSRLGYKEREKKPDQRRQKVEERGYKELRTVRQWMVEVPYTPEGSDKTYRLVIRRQLIEERKGGQVLSVKYHYYYIVTNLPRRFSTLDVIDLMYQRCDQENIIEQMGSALVTWRMPVAEFAGNCAWLEIARLAWNMSKWIAQLCLPAEVVRWEWKRFRQAFVYFTAEVLKRGGQIWVRLSHSHRFVPTITAAYGNL